MDLNVNFAIRKLQGELRAKSLPVEPFPDSVTPHILDDLSKDLWATIYGSFRQQLIAQGDGSDSEPFLYLLSFKRWQALFPNNSLVFEINISDDSDDSNGSGDSNGSSNPKDANSKPLNFKLDVLSADTSSSASEHKSLLNKAGKRAGTGGLPQFLKIAVERLLKDKIPYHIIFRKYLTGLAETDDYCYSSPDRRFLHADMILPSHPLDNSTELRKVVILLDVSGSISHAELKDFLARMRSILNSFEFDGVVVSFSGGVCQDVKLSSIRSLDKFIESIKVGGGTDFGNAVEYVKTKYEGYACVAVFTDGEFYGEDYDIKLPRSVFFLTNGTDSSIETCLGRIGKVIRLPEID